MSSAANVRIHESQFPENVRRDLLDSLRTRQVNHKFHYDSFKQTQKWLALHEAFSPSRKTADVAETYDAAFHAAAEILKFPRVHLIGLGCGGGQKDRRFLQMLAAKRGEIFYTPCDVSVAMTLVARKSALSVVPEKNCFPTVCDLATARDLPEFFGADRVAEAARVFTFFGMIPNFEPRMILPKLASLLESGDLLLFSANLAPGKSYQSGMEKILPQYENQLTRDWLFNFLLDLGIQRDSGEMRFQIEDDPAGTGLKRVAAWFHFSKPEQIKIGDNLFRFEPGEKIRLFFSCRHTPELVGKMVSEHGLRVCNQWIACSEEEGVFLLAKN
ncbi:MAG TPA: L-histidine N(alpha)-methyltransferase [Verrucomicrobiae bacterium]|nr:L-histidine N(alpha)-methyltransferase [Verrucomicrobiae bacterium]